MSDSIPSRSAMQEATSTVTVVEDETDEQDLEVPTLKLRLKKPKNDKKVQWSTETVDNEHLNKKKSKCCCIYNKPKGNNEDDDSSSSDDSDDECEHCKGHVEKKKNKIGSDDKKSNTTNNLNDENHISNNGPVSSN